MPSNSLDFHPMIHRIVQQSYNLYETLRADYGQEKAADMLPRIAWAIVLDYNADRDFDTSFNLIAETAGLPATVGLFSQFVMSEKVAEWKASYLEKNPESASDPYVTLQPMQSPASRGENRSRHNTDELWEKLREGSEEPTEEITSSMVNLQTAERIAGLSDSASKEK
jgi:hypothetical protein